MSLDQALMLPGIDAVTLASFSNLHAWYPADRIPSQTDDTALVTWSDQSGNGRNLTQHADEANSGIYRSTLGPNSKPYVRFEGAHGMEVTWPDIAQPNVLVAAMRSYVALTATDIFIDGPEATNRHMILSVGNPGNWAFASNTTQTSATAADTSWHVLYAEFDDVATDGRLYLDGTLIHTAETGTQDCGGVSLGCSFDGGNNSNMEVAELAVYSALQSAANRTAIINHLKTKYGVT